MLSISSLNVLVEIIISLKITGIHSTFPWLIAREWTFQLYGMRGSGDSR